MGVDWWRNNRRVKLKGENPMCTTQHKLDSKGGSPMCTVKRLLNLIAGVAALSLLLAACGPSPQQKMESLKKDTDALAASLNGDFVALRELGVKHANLIGKMLDSGVRQPDA